MFCTKCGKKNEVNGRFCTFCGAEMISTMSGYATSAMPVQTSGTNGKRKTIAIIAVAAATLVVVAIVIIVNISGSRLSGAWVFRTGDGDFMMTYSFSGKSVTRTETRVGVRSLFFEDGTELAALVESTSIGTYKIKDDKIEFVWTESIGKYSNGKTNISENLYRETKGFIRTDNAIRIGGEKFERKR